MGGLCGRCQMGFHHLVTWVLRYHPQVMTMLSVWKWRFGAHNNIHIFIIIIIIIILMISNPQVCAQSKSSSTHSPFAPPFPSFGPGLANVGLFLLLFFFYWILILPNRKLVSYSQSFLRWLHFISQFLFVHLF